MEDEHVERLEHLRGARWHLAGDLLHLRLKDGSCVVPSADEIYRIAVEGKVADGLSTPLASADIPPLAFSRDPVDLELDIESVNERGVDGLRIVVYAKAEDLQVALPNVSSRVGDHLVANGQWYPIAKGALEEAQAILRQAAVDADGKLNLKQYLMLLKLAGAFPALHDRSADAASAQRQRANADLTLPVGFAGELYPYQMDGWRWLQLVASQDVGGILADEMGLGKTVQIAVLLAAEADAQRKPSLVVATGTLLENWRRELKHFAPNVEVIVHRGADRTGFPRDLEPFDVVVTSYDTLVRDLSLLCSIQWNIVILDEAQAIKNSETRRSSGVKRIPRRVGIAVTGTPVENRLSDLWSIADFALPGFLGERAAFERRFSNDELGAETLEPLVSPILLRRRVADVAGDLPERIDIPQVLELADDQAVAYEELRRETIQEYGASAPLVALGRLRMFCAHPRLLRGGLVDLVEGSPKYERLCEILDELLASGEKALIFTSFNAMADLLVEDLGRRFAVPTTFIDGRTPIEERQTVVDRFSSTRGGAVMVLNPRAAGTGLNITAANHVIHYNLEWNPAVEDQASARAHRRGQERPVTVHRLLYADTVEEVIDQRLEVKRSLAGKAVIGVDGTEDSLSDIASALARSPVKGGAKGGG